jgi:hypothetical protein
MIDRVLDAFDRWLAVRDAKHDPRSDAMDVVRTACEFKADFFDAPNPADWPADVTAEVIGDLMPRKVVADEQYVDAIVPAMQTYLDFLVSTGRWKARNDERSTRRELSRLKDELPERFAEPEGTSVGKRIATLALNEGVDLDDPAELADFQRRFNEMPFDWRRRVTDGMTDTLADHDFDDDDFDEYELDDDEYEWSEEEQAALDRAISIALDFADMKPGTPVRVTVVAADDEWRALSETAFVQRILDLVAWVTPSRPVTSTDAMSRADTREWVARLGLRSAAENPRSMWDIRELALPWRVAIDADLISISGSTAAPGTHAAVLAQPGPDRVAVARLLVRSLIERTLLPGANENEISLAVGAILMSLLVSAFSADGQNLAQIRTDPREVPAPDVDNSFARALAGLALMGVEQLRDWGLLHEIDGRVFVPANLRGAMAEALNAPEAPFRFRLMPGAVPVAD